GTRSVARNFLTPPRRTCDRENAFNDTDFMIKLSAEWRANHQLVRPPLNSNSEVTEELLLIRLIASPNKPATDNVVTLTPSITGRTTVSVVMSSSISDFRNLSMPQSFKIA